MLNPSVQIGHRESCSPSTKSLSSDNWNSCLDCFSLDAAVFAEFDGGGLASDGVCDGLAVVVLDNALMNITSSNIPKSHWLNMRVENRVATHGLYPVHAHVRASSQKVYSVHVAFE